MRDVLLSLLPGIRPGTLITDVGSVKGSVVAELEPLAEQAGAHFVGSHPMAGAEAAGPAAARPDLLVNAVTIVTTHAANRPSPPYSGSSRSGLASARPSCGLSRKSTTTWSADRVIYPTSSRPSSRTTSLSPAHPPEQRCLCASGFRDTTRVAASPADLWRDIVLANRDNLLRVLGVFIEGLEEFGHAFGGAGRSRAAGLFPGGPRTEKRVVCHPTHRSGGLISGPAPCRCLLNLRSFLRPTRFVVAWPSPDPRASQSRVSAGRAGERPGDPGGSLMERGHASDDRGAPATRL
jgi:hypothetical protein